LVTDPATGTKEHRLIEFADTTDLAAMAAWEVLQGFYAALPQLDSKVHSTKFNLWTESYGGG
jgi:hypothetical protein